MKLFFRKYGDAGPPLIILHGLYGSSDNWVSIARELSDQFEVYVPDQRNHGESPHDEVHDYRSMSNDLCEFMDEHGIEKAALLGHSMGGKTAMLFAMECPERIASLIVVDIAPVPYHDLATNSRIAANHGKMIDAMMAVDITSADSRGEVSKALSTAIGSKRVRMFLMKNLTRDDDQRFRWQINLSALRNNLDEIMEGLPYEEVVASGGLKGFPVLFVRGEESDYIRPEHHATIKRIFPTAEIVSIPGAGHWLHAEQPELLLKNLNYFLR
jgi:pimeloyl-ACP methyl ester carboxylesterase